MITENIVTAAKQGDEEAFLKLMYENKTKLYRIAFSYLKNELDSLEAIQEVTYRAYIKIRKLRNPKYFNTWLVRIMINYCIDELRKRNKMIYKEIEFKSFDVSTSNLSIENAIEILEPKYKTVIILKYINDYTIQEIARIMQRPEGTIKTWLNKSLKLLREYYDKDGEFENA